MAATNKPEPTLADIMENIISMKLTLTDVQTKISNLEKLEHKINEIKENQDKVNFRVVQVEESQEYISKCFEKQQGDIDKILATNTIQLEQYGHREMIEVSGISVKENENCIDIIKRLGSLIGLNVNNSIEIAHRIKNGDIIVKFRDRPSRDSLFRAKDKLKGKTTKDLEFNEEKFIYINESLAFDTKKLLLTFARNARNLALKTSSPTVESLK